MDGFLLIDKPKNISSAQLSRKIRNKFCLQKVGHGGTLDPFATGLLVLCVNEATKMAAHMLTSQKEYEGLCLLGTETDTYDVTGKVLSFESNLSISNEALRLQMQRNIGWIEQRPPLYSAVKKDGKPLYTYARKNIKIECVPRNVCIYDFQMTERKEREFQFRVCCSKGTYVRALCHDLGKQLGTVACLKELRRTKSGRFKIEDAIEMSELTDKNFSQDPHWIELSKLKELYF